MSHSIQKEIENWVKTNLSRDYDFFVREFKDNVHRRFNLPINEESKLNEKIEEILYENKKSEFKNEKFIRKVSRAIYDILEETKEKEDTKLDKILYRFGEDNINQILNKY